jgi:hypothetical protein
VLNEQFPFWYGKDLIFDNGFLQDEENSLLQREESCAGFDEWCREMRDKTG